MKLSSYFLLCTLFFLACNKPNNDDNGGGNPGSTGAVEITSTPTNYPFWGDTITIAGKGFGSTAADVAVTFLSNLGPYTSASGKTKIVSVTETSLKVTVPVDLTPAGNKFGPDYAKLIVKVKEKADTSDNIKFVGLPFMNAFCYFYGGIGATARAGDSAILSMGIPGLYAQESGYYNKIKLEGYGIIPRTAGACSGFAMLMRNSDFADGVYCVNDPQLGEPAKTFSFKMYIEGANKSISKDLKVFTQPTITVNQFIGPAQISLSNPGNPAYTINGINLNFHTIKVIGLNFATTTAPSPGGWVASQTYALNLSGMVVNKSYSMIGIGPCDKEYQLGSVLIQP